MFSISSKDMLRSVATKYIDLYKQEALRYPQSEMVYNNLGCSPST